jgi:hypothetical protein
VVLKVVLRYALGIHPLQVERSDKAEEKLEGAGLVFAAKMEKQAGHVVEALAVSHVRQGSAAEDEQDALASKLSAFG